MDKVREIYVKLDKKAPANESAIKDDKKPAPEKEQISVDLSKVDAPKVDEPKVDEPKVDAPKVEAPKVEVKVEEPKVDTVPAPTEIDINDLKESDENTKKTGFFGRLFGRK